MSNLNGQIKWLVNLNSLITLAIVYATTVHFIKVCQTLFGDNCFIMPFYI